MQGHLEALVHGHHDGVERAEQGAERDRVRQRIDALAAGADGRAGLVVLNGVRSHSPSG